MQCVSGKSMVNGGLTAKHTVIFFPSISSMMKSFANDQLAIGEHIPDRLLECCDSDIGSEAIYPGYQQWDLPQPWMERSKCSSSMDGAIWIASSS